MIIVPLGSKDYSHLQAGRQFKWSHGRFKYLGIQMDTDIGLMNYANFRNVEAEVDQAFAARSNYFISLLGQILISKQLVVSKFIYRFLLVPGKPNLGNIQKQLIHNIWHGKRHKINTSRLFSTSTDFGANMVNIEWTFHSLRISWINRLFLHPNEFWSK